MSRPPCTSRTRNTGEPIECFATSLCQVTSHVLHSPPWHQTPRRHQRQSDTPARRWFGRLLLDDRQARDGSADDVRHHGQLGPDRPALTTISPTAVRSRVPKVVATASERRRWCGTGSPGSEARAPSSACAPRRGRSASPGKRLRGHRTSGGARQPRRFDGDAIPVPSDGRLHPGPLHDDHRRHHRQRRPPDALSRLRRAVDRDRVGVDRLPARPRRRDPGLRLARRPIRDQEDVPRRAGRVRPRVGRLRRGPEPGGTDRLPGRPGSRRRDDHPDR